MSVHSPTSDDVFDKFVERTPLKKLEKYFGIKGVEFEKDNISAAESVTNVVKSAVFFFRSEFSPEKAQKTYEKIEADLKKLSKTSFYEFPKHINQLEWKGKEIVPTFNSIVELNCKKCNGKGFENCKKCDGKGFNNCNKCNGSGKVDCQKCRGKGEKEVELEIFIGSTDKKEKRSLKYQCNECLGTGKIVCITCEGRGTELCGNCKPNLGKIPCKECNGIGKTYKYKIESVPFEVSKEHYIPHLFFKPEFEKALGEELNSIITTVDGIYIKNLKDLDEKFVKAQLGYMDGDIKSRMKNVQKYFKELQKSKGPESPKFPIYLFPVLKLEVKTEKGKEFYLYSIGSERGFTVFAPKF